MKEKVLGYENLYNCANFVTNLGAVSKSLLKRVDFSFATEDELDHLAEALKMDLEVEELSIGTL